MKPWVRCLLGSFVILIAIGLVYLYQFFGLKYFIKALGLINSSPTQDQRLAWDTLDLNAETDFAQNGTLAQINKKDNKIVGVWIWGLKGLKYFKTDMNTTLSYFSICENNKWKASSGQIGKTSNVSSNDWQKHVRVGDYVIVNFSSQPSQKNSMIINEAIGFDWWIFIKNNRLEYLKETCKNR